MIVELFTSGVEGIPVSYSPRTDDTIALTLLVCFFLSSIALAKERFCTASRTDKYFR